MLTRRLVLELLYHRSVMDDPSASETPVARGKQPQHQASAEAVDGLCDECRSCQTRAGACLHFLVERISEPIQVPDNPYSRLRYYLFSATHCFGVRIPEQFVSSQPLAEEPTPEFTVLLVGYCMFFSPKNLSRVFIHDENLGSFNNDFFRITPETPHRTADSLRIQGVRLRVRKIMKFRAVWLQRHYLEPMSRLLPVAKQLATHTEYRATLRDGFLQLHIVTRAGAALGGAAGAAEDGPPRSDHET